MFCIVSPELLVKTKLDIKKDKKGLVYVQGSVVRNASSADELYSHFEFGSQNRHTASTSKSLIHTLQCVRMYTCIYISSEMNTESSRSHLIVGIVIESTNLTTGAVTKGKVTTIIQLLW